MLHQICFSHSATNEWKPDSLSQVIALKTKVIGSHQGLNCALWIVAPP